MCWLNIPLYVLYFGSGPFNLLIIFIKVLKFFEEKLRENQSDCVFD